jgi:hypothetical protein
MFRLAAIAAIVALGAPANADTTAQNLDKYRRLRHRLVSDFTSVGDGPGQSQPCPERTDAQGLMKWGDGTIALGFYLGVLATEHYMLSNPSLYPGADGGDANALATNEDELYRALLALERLDNVANAAFPAPCTQTPALDGFFLRDDVPAEIASKFPGITTIQSDFLDPALTNKEESQDQVYHVQHGLALVVALVPASTVVRGKGLHDWAIQQAQRITQHFATGDWMIRNPACSNRVVARGPNAIGYSYGETLAASFVTAGAFKPTTDPFWMNIWDTLRQTTNPAYNDEDNLHMALAIMAVGDGYAGDTAQVIATLADLQDWPLYPLLHRVLHPENAGFCTTWHTVNPRVRTMLDELPAAGEPACPGPTPAPHGFTTHNRFIRGKAQAYVGPPGCVGVRYHGLDYMLLHNLYAIATPRTWNGDPNADPCAVVSDDIGTTGDVTMPPDADTIEPTHTGGCGCAARGDANIPVLAIAIMWILRRKRGGSPL